MIAEFKRLSHIDVDQTTMTNTFHNEDQSIPMKCGNGKYAVDYCKNTKWL